jgi:hypothetical protein
MEIRLAIYLSNSRNPGNTPREKGSLPWLDEMRHSEQCPKDNTDAPNDNIGNTQERILTTHDRRSGYYEGFCTTVFGDREI